MMNTLMKILQKTIQLALVIYLFSIPWLYWHGDGGIAGGVFYTIGLTAFLLWSEVGEVFNDGGFAWLFSFKLRSSPKRIVDTETGKKYWISVYRTVVNESTYVIFYKNFFIFWWVDYYQYTGYSEIEDIDILKKSVEKSVKGYEEELTERLDKKGHSAKVKSWDGLIGSEGSIKSYRRGERLNHILGDEPKEDD